MFAMITATSVAHGKPDAGKPARPVWREERRNRPPEGGAALGSYSTRLSRSLLDFARMMEVFDRAQVSFVSVTQQFNTASSMGRLILNVLLSFAQFEREMISERTREKMAATRRKGRWVGGRPVLGYDLSNSQLVVNEQEAEQVSAIFQCYLERRGLLPVVRWLEERGGTQKRWMTRAGEARAAGCSTRAPFTRSSRTRPIWAKLVFRGNCIPANTRRSSTRLYGARHKSYSRLRRLELPGRSFSDRAVVVPSRFRRVTGGGIERGGHEAKAVHPRIPRRTA